jgi:hypothetical protein
MTGHVKHKPEALTKLNTVCTTLHLDQAAQVAVKEFGIKKLIILEHFGQEIAIQRQIHHHVNHI